MSALFAFATQHEWLAWLAWLAIVGALLVVLALEERALRQPGMRDDADLLAAQRKAQAKRLLHEEHDLRRCAAREYPPRTWPAALRDESVSDAPKRAQPIALVVLIVVCVSLTGLGLGLLVLAP